ncbi:SRPBCC domain-containing protein [Streptomyces sp. NBC_00190]|uniref:SRPBCC family protein n=1 Tax=unclassified Streptomyces TaxID=2593676 RepID=UPI002E284C7C|nr:SRPBCC domain-containing protein [Streptomyces sp. NBC_00190]WSZ44160.1 SRPBCC domain-containing protein [Streptomyces sp. NBC_00868]
MTPASDHGHDHDHGRDDGNGLEAGGPDDLTTVRVDQFLPHPPAKVWRALTEPELIAQWLMPSDFRLEVGHRYTMTSPPRPNTGYSGTTAAEVLAYETGRMLSVRWTDASAANTADWTITWTLAPEGRGTRLFLVHEGFDPDDPAQMLARKIMGGGWRGYVMDALGAVLDRL